MTAPRAGIVVFPGTNCERDCAHALRGLGAEVEMVWHTRTELTNVDVVILPGGFAHGDYLRTGAIARFSPIMAAVRSHASSGGLVLGICNGFQILCEAGLLPGALRKNRGLKFICRWIEVRVDNPDTPFTSRARRGQVLRIPINHFEGNWYCEEAELGPIRGGGRVPFRYLDNPNGAVDDAAGVINDGGNVLGLMPHPERACDLLLGSEDGVLILGSMLDHAVRPVAVGP